MTTGRIVGRCYFCGLAVPSQVAVRVLDPGSASKATGLPPKRLVHRWCEQDLRARIARANPQLPGWDWPA